MSTGSNSLSVDGYSAFGDTSPAERHRQAQREAGPAGQAKDLEADRSNGGNRLAGSGLDDALGDVLAPPMPAALRVVPGRRGDRLSTAHLVLAVLLMAFGVLATLPAWADIYSMASVDEEYSHIFTVPLVALWLVYVRRTRIRRTRPTGQIVGCVLVAVGWLLSTFGFYNGVQSMWHGGAVLLVVGCGVAAVGKNVVLNFFPALLVLAFMVPVPGRVRQAIAMPLQSWTASTASAVLETAGFGVEVMGNTLRVNGTVVTVAEACNGIRMVFALALVCYALAFAMPLRNSLRLLIVLLSPIAALLCNIIRTLPTVLLYGYAPAEVGDRFHDYSGWAMLPLAFAMLYMLIRLLRWAQVPVQRFTLASQ